MLTEADAFNAARPRLLGLVQRAEHRAGSRMLAYEAVARGIGVSASWVRKALGRQPVGAPWHVIENIRFAYEADCERLEAEQQLDRERFYALGKEDHAVATGKDRRLGVAPGASVPRAGRARLVVRPMVDKDGQ